jgi:hypothetical protein
LANDDHQGCGCGETTRQPAGCLARSPHNLTGLIENHRRRLASPCNEAQDDGDRNDPDYSEEGCQPIQLLRIVDL